MERAKKSFDSANGAGAGEIPDTTREITAGESPAAADTASAAARILRRVDQRLTPDVVSSGPSGQEWQNYPKDCHMGD